MILVSGKCDHVLACEYLNRENAPKRAERKEGIKEENETGF